MDFRGNPLDGLARGANHNVLRMSNYCCLCQGEVHGACIMIGDILYHSKCAKCFYCAKQLISKSFFANNNNHFS